jgi:hypothetical protein
MEIYIIILAIIFTLLIGIYWGYRSIKGDTIDKEQEYEELDRLHL